jgi:hypothetical protein
MRHLYIKFDATPTPKPQQNPNKTNKRLINKELMSINSVHGYSVMFSLEMLFAFKQSNETRNNENDCAIFLL